MIIQKEKILAILDQNITNDKKAEKIVEIMCENNSTMIHPNTDELVMYVSDKELLEYKTIDEIKTISELFINYYDSVDWVVGKNKKPMKSWKKAMNNWCKRSWNQNSRSKVQESIKAYLMLTKQ